MQQMIYILTKQLQLIEVELGVYKIAKKYKEPLSQTEAYYAKLAHAHKGVKYAISALNKSNQESDYVH